MQLLLQERTYTTVAELRAALAHLDPTMLVQTQNPPYHGVMLAVDGNRVTLRAPRNSKAQ